MARISRIDLPGFPQHLVQRGVNRSACFNTEEDRNFFLYQLKQCASEANVQIHAYVLMTNHVHILVTGEKSGAISSMMQNLGRIYVLYFNRVYNRIGTLWQGRFKSNLVDTEYYLLQCYRYIELNPVRANLVSAPDKYPWSSIHANAYGQWDPVITPHAAYKSLGDTSIARRARYLELLRENINDRDLKLIRDLNAQGKVLRSEKFCEQVQSRIGKTINIRYRSRGRPTRHASNNP